MLKKINLFLKAISSDPVRLMIQAERARQEHTRLLPDHSFFLDQVLLEEAKLVADRHEMLRRMPKGARVAEIGVAMGTFSHAIWEICQPQELHLIDPWFDESDGRYSAAAYAAVLEKFETEIASGRVIVHRGLSQVVLPTFAPSSLDWVYIDGAHDYNVVAQDILLCARAVKAGGLIAGHDYVRWAGPAQRYGVTEAVNKFAAETGSPFVFLTNQFDKHDSYALRLCKS